MTQEMECGCASDACDYDGEPLDVKKHVSSHKVLEDQECCECGRMIKRGEIAEYLKAREYGTRKYFEDYTCSQCLAIARDYLCDCRLHGGMRDQIRALLGVDIVTGKTAGEKAKPPYTNTSDFWWE